MFLIFHVAVGRPDTRRLRSIEVVVRGYRYERGGNRGGNQSRW
jgi:hypothetical protein